MKNILLNYLFSILLISSFVSCEEEENMHEYNGPSLVSFLEPDAVYFVLELNDPGYDVVVGTSKPASVARTFTINVDEENSTAVLGNEFNLENNTVTIPAGELLGTTKILGNFESLESPGKIVLQISGEESSLASFYQTKEIVIQQFCPYEQANFLGTWQVTSTLFEETWTVNAITGTDDNEIIFESLYESGKDVNVILDNSDPANFKAAVPSQVGWVSNTYGNVTIKGPGNFSACNGTINLVLDHCISAGCYPDDNLALKKL